MQLNIDIKNYIKNTYPIYQSLSINPIMKRSLYFTTMLINN